MLSSLLTCTARGGGWGPGPRTGGPGAPEETLTSAGSDPRRGQNAPCPAGLWRARGRGMEEEERVHPSRPEDQAPAHGGAPLPWPTRADQGLPSPPSESLPSARLERCIYVLDVPHALTYKD